MWVAHGEDACAFGWAGGAEFEVVGLVRLGFEYGQVMHDVKVQERGRGCGFVVEDYVCFVFSWFLYKKGYDMVVGGDVALG